MREALSAPATMQGLLRYFHRSRAASADKHLCARGTTLWTHIRNLVCKGKVGWGWALVSLGGGGGCVRAGSLLPRGLSQFLSLSLCLSAASASSQLLRGRGPVMTGLWGEREGFLLPNLPVSLF